MSSASFSRLATATASTQRTPAISGGKRGAPVTQIASLNCTPLDPLDAEIRQRLALETPHELLQTFVDNGLDIAPGDVLVQGAKEYPIRAVEDWVWRSTTYRLLVLEDLKR